MKSALKTVVLSLFRVFRPSLSAGAILMYHSVGENNAFFSVRPEEFARQMAWVAERKFKVVFLSELVAMIRQKKNSVAGYVAITFDDGYKDFLQNAAPVLRQHNFPASVFLISDMLGASYTTSDGISFPLMNAAEAQEAKASGRVEYFPHTAKHTILDQVSAQEAIQEIEKSKNDIAEKFGRSANILAFPKGRHTSEIIEYLRHSNFTAAVTVQEGFVTPAGDPFLLPRLSVDSSTSFAQFKAKLSDGYGAYLSLRKYL